MKHKILTLTILLCASSAFAQSWQEISKNVASDRAIDDRFGSAVAISGDYAIVGASAEDEDVTGGNTILGAGSSYIFEKNVAGNWVEHQKLVAPDRQSLDQFGAQVAIAGDYAIVTAIQEDDDVAGNNPLNGAGSAYIFERNASGVWNFVQKIVSSDRGTSDFFGSSVSMYGDYAVIGAVFEDSAVGSSVNDKVNSGSAYIFHRNTAGVWSETQKITASVRDDEQYFGSSVGMDANYLIVGANREQFDSNGTNSLFNAGAAYFFELDTTSGSWVQTQKITPTDRASNNRFGSSVAIVNTTVVVTSPNDELDETGGNPLSLAGSAHVFERNLTTGNWGEISKLVAPDRDVSNSFGFSSAVSGDHIVVGAIGNTTDATGNNALSNAGAAYYFNKNGAGNWLFNQKLTASDREQSDQFAWSLALDGDNVIIATPNEDDDLNGGNSMSASGAAYFFELVPNTPPTISCPGNLSLNNDVGQCGAIVSLSQLNGTDNEDGTILAVQTGGPASGSLFPVGVNTVTFTVTDSGGLTASCSYTVTVLDNEAPVVNCLNTSFGLDTTGNLTIAAIEITGGSSDNCSVSLSLSQSSFTCADLGANTVVVTATDPSGNTTTCNSIVTIVDIDSPIVVCNDITIQLDSTGTATISPTDLETFSFDNCNYTLSLSQSTFTCVDVGFTLVDLIATDQSGNTASCQALVTVEDNSTPTAACQDVTVFLDATGNAIVTEADINNGSVDNCDLMYTISQTNFSCADIGTNSITLTASDSTGNSDSCTATVTVVDDLAPLVICQDITVSLDSFGLATISAIDIDNGSLDNCGIASMSIDSTNFDCTHVGLNNVLLTATDVNGNSATCTATVTIVDSTFPVVNCQNIVVQLDGSGIAAILPSDLDNGSNDNCGVSLSISQSSFSCNDLGVNTVVLTVEDPSGNTTTCSASVTVEDNIAPLVICQDIIVELDANGMASIVASDVDNGSSDNCTLDDLTIDISLFDCSNIGTPVAVTLTAIDVSGNSASCVAMVTVVDLIMPELICPLDHVVTIANGDQYEVPDYFGNGDVLASDNCTNPITNFSQVPSPGSLLTEGVYTINVTAEDDYGNVSNCDFELTVDELLGIVGANFQEVTLFPNPAKDAFSVSSISGKIVDEIAVYDLHGRLIQSKTNSNSVREMLVDVSSLPASVYLVVLRVGNENIVHQLIIQ